MNEAVEKGKLETLKGRREEAMPSLIDGAGGNKKDRKEKGKSRRVNSKL